jgi:hypothetical protein
MKLDAIAIFGVIALVLIAVYLLDPTFFGLLGKSGSEGWQDASSPDTTITGAKKNTRSTGDESPGMMDEPGSEQLAAEIVNPNVAEATEEGFESGPADFGGAQAPAGCYPRDQLSATELLPKDGSSVWAQQNPLGPGSLKGKNFLSAGALIGVNTVGQSLRNANLQLRSEPPNPQVPVSIFLQSTIGPDISHRPLEVGS